jgi:mono/diheme cytochrome c family protein
LTEIPEHLLKRSRERRSAMGGGDGGDAGEAAAPESGGSAATPAKAPAASTPSMPAHPAPETTPAAPPPSPMVEAYQKRRKVPFWAMPVLAALPLWAYVYQGTLSPPPAGEGPELLGEELYASAGCAGCHGGGGGGGVGPAFTGGAIYETFPDFIEHFEWVRLGSAGWQAERGDTYGAPGKPVNGGMPGYTEGQLTDADLIYVVLHERLLGGANPDAEDEEMLLELAEWMSEHDGATLEEAMAELGFEMGGGETTTEDTPGSEGRGGPSTPDSVGGSPDPEDQPPAVGGDDTTE